MKTAFVKIARWVAGFGAFLLGFTLLYCSLIVFFGLIPVNISFAQAEKGIQVFVIDNGVHTDLVLPASTNTIDWREHLRLKDYPGADSTFTHFGFGWGNRRFYMETPEWSDLNLDIALSAALGIGKSAMHVYYFAAAPKPGKNEIELHLTEEQYAKLVQYIFNTFQRDENGRFLLIKNKGYTRTDNFYEANGRFSLIKTCNGWTNTALKKAGIETVFWAPLPHLMMRKLRRLDQ
ncbi:TIGR02117 family protein [Adhaeribacter terreus]|uniref:TIGR02117 family protein n=1 Tax=Adhaeribacter terreus TaxID=529703 RepID=A0ABW0EF33_9BACT